MRGFNFRFVNQWGRFIRQRGRFTIEWVQVAAGFPIEFGGGFYLRIVMCGVGFVFEVFDSRSRARFEAVWDQVSAAATAEIAMIAGDGE